MKNNSWSTKIGIFILCSLFYSDFLSAQLTINGQVRTRTEFRDGLGTLRLKTNDPALFTSQRTRLGLAMKDTKVNLGLSFQDVRVWGQDASSISNADGSKLGLHEAWADIVLLNSKDTSFKSGPFDYMSLKIGRQELVYDDVRLLGNLDWLQQARRHDAAVLKMMKKGWQIDLGLAYNQNTDAFNYNGTYYTPANIPATVRDSKGNMVSTPSGMVPLVSGTLSSRSGSPSFTNPPSTNGMNQHYKGMQMLYMAKTFGNIKASGLVLADQFAKYSVDSVQTSTATTGAGYVYGRKYNVKGLNGRYTGGVLLGGPLNAKKTISFTAGAYYQGGTDKDGLEVSAYTTTATMSYQKGKVTYTAGWDIVSGNDAFNLQSGKTSRFDPLYGTPHKFWGFMDYFYVGTGSPVGGLSDPFLKMKYTSKSKNFNIGMDYHHFMLAADMKDKEGIKLNKYLGSEVDVIGQYKVNKLSTIEFGYCVMASSSSMEYAKGIAPGTANLFSNWGYIMINITPSYSIK